MKKWKSNRIYQILIITGVMFFSMLPVSAYELDLSVDEEIQKKYNSSKLNYDVLPELPKIDSTSSKPTSTPSSVPKSQPTFSASVPTITPIDKSTAVKIPKWTKFSVKSNQTISDSMKPGTVLSFTTTAPVYKKSVTIPSGARIDGVITDSHRPQVTGNGGLVVIRLNSITYNGKTFAIDGKITKSNSKKVFLNNIKGKRQYWSGVAKQIDKGENFYNKSRTVSNKFSNNPILVILSPVPTVVGVAGYTVNTLISPLTALTTKGGALSVPYGSQFEIKLLNNAYVN